MSQRNPIFISPICIKYLHAIPVLFPLSTPSDSTISAFIILLRKYCHPILLEWPPIKRSHLTIFCAALVKAQKPPDFATFFLLFASVLCHGNRNTKEKNRLCRWKHASGRQQKTVWIGFSSFVLGRNIYKGLNSNLSTQTRLWRWQKKMRNFSVECGPIRN